jgi:KEOPS complex subunit Cgi121
MQLVEGVVHVGSEADADGTDTDGTGAERFGSVDTLVARLDEIADAHGVTVQAFDARYIVDRTHLRRAVELADRERERDEGIARDRAVEILLYAAGRRQIDRALAMGVGEGATPAVVLVDAPPGADGPEAAESGAADAVREILDPADTLGNYDPERVRTFFDIGDAELAATAADLPALVRERVALLIVER